MIASNILRPASRTLALLVLGSLAWGQVNTEAMRKADLTTGFHTDLRLDFSMIAGNTNLSRIKTGLRFDYLKGAAHSFLAYSYQQGSLVEEDFVNKGFVHLRRTQSLRSNLAVEGFMQKEYNEFIRLKERNLAGGGLRIRWLKYQTDQGKPIGMKITTGLGFMWEQEQIRNARDSEDRLKDLVRSTNYLVLGWLPDERLLLQLTTYLQPDIQQPKDFRVLFDGGFAFTLTGKLSAVITLNARYDNEPPVVLEKNGSEKILEKYDMELTSGLVYKF
jgi:hypothetical protein